VVNNLSSNVRSFTTAVNQFEEDCAILPKAYVETAKECADTYIYYGQSLLHLACMENGVLGNALKRVPTLGG
jgi:nuclear autoantigenic sperm protein